MELLLIELKNTIASVDDDQVPPWIRRYYHKLAYLCKKRSEAYNNLVVYTNEDVNEDYIILEKQPAYTCFVAPYTCRTLKPFVVIDRETVPPRLQLLSEICHKQDRSYKRRPIVYKYLQKRHVKPINRLCEIHFWPGIDISEALEFPEFSVVVEYRRIVIGFGFMVPNATQSDAYISFIFTLPGWRRAGIARFMLYHLIMTCRGKDITLHVSASNTSALLLYQQFAFKPQEFIQNFYDKFIPPTSRECRHAFFLRLSK